MNIVSSEPVRDTGHPIAEPGQLRAECGWLMAAVHAERHTLVYACDPDRCGRHHAHIADVQVALLLRFRRWLAEGGELVDDVADAELIAPMFTHLGHAWIRDETVRDAQFLSTL